MRWWKSSTQDAAAQSEYKHQFREILQSRHQLIQLWVSRQRRNKSDITLLCYEKPLDFCHRHQVGEEVVQKYLPELWGGEVSLLADNGKNKDIDTTDTPIITLTSFAVSPNSTTNQLITPKQPISIDPTFPPTVQMLLSKCHDAGLLVKCNRLPCGYFRVTLDGQDLGEWSELGVLGVLSGLPSEVYRGRGVGSG
ncbi:hypothetical protein IQ244_26115 [Nostoc sp. LEGE 06077]|uniref:DUF488 family protein, N3 subclade n=1 Tax=Nostoc sp. LEGE 06077 TaxID=915325 RepID=UPI001881D2EE|nr:hypothetical protein [Nostoc sp. LEGE 06077]MBE9209907.1 hypothetical protein [Nostoc sp. LEGE 06077]